MIATLAVIATLIAGHPTSVTCDADTNIPQSLGAPSGQVVMGWAYPGGSEVHLHPTYVCDPLAKLSPRGVFIGDRRFALGLVVLLHEAWHANGVKSEACANLKAQLVSFDILRRFWGIPFYSQDSLVIGGQMNQLSMQQDPHYWPNPGSCE